MVRTKHILVLLLVITGTATHMFAQNNKGGITNEEVTVVKEYEATIQDAQKINIQPNIPEVEETKPKLDYNVPQQEVKDFPYEASPLKPISMPQQKLERYNTSYVQLGFGTQLNPFAQLAYNDDKSKNTRFGIYYNHYSMASYKNKLENFSDDRLGAYIKHYINQVEVGGGISFRNYRTHFYGIDTAFYGADTSFHAKDQRQIFRNYNAEAYFKNATPNKYNINYGQTLRFNYLQQTEATGHANEWAFTGTSHFDKTFAKYHTVYGLFNFDGSHLKNDSLVLNRAIFTPEVGYGFNNNDWRGHGQVGFAVQGSKVVFVTDLHVEKSIYRDNFLVFLGYNRRYMKNSLDSFIQVNNFIQNYVAIQNSSVDDFSAGVKGTVDNFSYNVAFNLMHVKNMAFFVNDTLDPKRFLVTYDPSTWIYNFHYEIGYNTKEWLRLSLFGDLNLYTLKTEARPWQEPLFKLTARGNYVWKNKLILGADIYVLSSSFAKLAEGQQKKLAGTFDMNLNAEYLFNKHLSFFISGNNLFNVKYQQYNGYRSFGINGLVGAKYSF